MRQEVSTLTLRVLATLCSPRLAHFAAKMFTKAEIDYQINISQMIYYRNEG